MIESGFFGHTFQLPFAFSGFMGVVFVKIQLLMSFSAFQDPFFYPNPCCIQHSCILADIKDSSSRHYNPGQKLVETDEFCIK